MYIQTDSFSSLIPCAGPQAPGKGMLSWAELKHFSVPPEWAFLAPQLTALGEVLTHPLTPGGDRGVIAFECDRQLPLSGWRITVEEKNIAVTAADPAGAFYGFIALSQMLVTHTAMEFPDCRLNTGTIADAPRYEFRGLMLDSARRMQSVAQIKRILRIMAAYRLNIFHWHLTDNEGFRIESKTAPELNTFRDGEPQFYRAAEIREITEYAEKLFIAVIPEIDCPGHCGLLLQKHPELACDPNSDWRREICLGNPAATGLLRKLLHEMIDLFPKSRRIHIGGDEAATVNWDKCPRCQNAIKAGQYDGIRMLEHQFLAEMAAAVLQRHRIPVVWETPLPAPEGCEVQYWDRAENALRCASGGNRMIFSQCRNFYLDYPSDPAEPHPDWMPILSADDVYHTEPFAGWPAPQPGQYLGVEACLWTEFIPGRRLFAKLLPRLAAFSECAWSRPERKKPSDFKARQLRLENSNWLEILDKTIAKGMNHD